MLVVDPMHVHRAQKLRLCLQTLWLHACAECGDQPFGAADRPPFDLAGALAAAPCPALGRLQSLSIHMPSLLANTLQVRTPTQLPIHPPLHTQSTPSLRLGLP